MFRLSLILSLLFVFASCSSNKETKLSPSERKGEIYYSYGTHELVNKEYTKALDYLLKALELTPKDSKVHNNLGMTYYFKEQKELAVKHLKKAIDLDPKNTDARNNLASIYLTMGKTEEARSEYMNILKDLTYQNHYRTYYNLGLLDKSNGRIRDARKHFTKSIEISADYCPAHFELGLINYRNRQFKKALEDFKKAGQGTCYKSPAPQYHQALSSIQLGDYDSARLRLINLTDRFTTGKYLTMAQLKLREIRGKTTTKFTQKNDISQKTLQNSKEYKNNLETPQF